VMAAPAPAPSQNGTDSLFPPAQNETASFFGQRLPVAPLSQHEGCMTNVSGTPIYTCFTQNSTSDNQILTSCASPRLARPQPQQQCMLGAAQRCTLAPAPSEARTAECLTQARCVCRLWFCLVGGSVCLLLFGLLRGLLRSTYHKRLVRRPPAALPAGPSSFTTLLREPARQAHTGVRLAGCCVVRMEHVTQQPTRGTGLTFPGLHSDVLSPLAGRPEATAERSDRAEHYVAARA